MSGLVLAGAQLVGCLGKGGFLSARACWRGPSWPGGDLAGVSDSECGSGDFIPSGYGHLVAGFADFFE